VLTADKKPFTHGGADDSWRQMAVTSRLLRSDIAFPLDELKTGEHLFFFFVWDRMFSDSLGT